MFKMKLSLTLTAAVALAVFTASAATPPPTLLLTKRTEAQLIAVLKSDAPLKDKADACRELGVIGTKECVPVLAPMLVDEQFNHIARYALEPNPDPSVDTTLRAALATAKGRPLVGVIGSIGVRRDLQATDALAKFLADADADMAQAAARALGKIGTLKAAKAIQGAFSGTAAGNQLGFAEGALRCAEALATKGQRDEAVGIYDWLRGLKEPHQVRAGGWRGAILARGKEGLPLLTQALQSDDWIIVAAGARAALEMKGTEATPVLTAELGKGSADKQVLVAQVLGKRGDAAALPALITAAKAGDKTVRIAAIRALAEVGQPSPTPALVDLLGDTDPEIAKAAQESLAGLQGAEVDAAVMALVNGTDSARRVIGIDLTARRRMVSAVPALLKAGSDADDKVRTTAMRRVGELAGVNEIPALLAALNNAKGAQDMDAIEQALSTVCTKSEKPEDCAVKIAGSIEQAQPAQKGALLRVLSAIGGPAALKAVRAAVDDKNADVHAAAIRALGSWKTADAAPDLLALAQSATNPTDRKLCLRSYLGLASQAELPADQRLAMCQKAAASIQKADEKKMLLGTLGGIQTLEAIAAIAPYLEDAEVKNEASTATLGIADRLMQSKSKGAQAAPKLVAPLQKVVQAAATPDLVKRAEALLAQAQRGGKK